MFFRQKTLESGVGVTLLLLSVSIIGNHDYTWLSNMDVFKALVNMRSFIEFHI